jgi:hypothetical protein
MTEDRHIPPGAFRDTQDASEDEVRVACPDQFFSRLVDGGDELAVADALSEMATDAMNLAAEMIDPHYAVWVRVQDWQSWPVGLGERRMLIVHIAFQLERIP